MIPERASPAFEEERLRLAARSYAKRVKYHQLDGVLGPTAGLSCLDVGGDEGILSAWLRRRGGTWTSVERAGPAFEALQRAVGDERVAPLAPGAPLPFEANAFDCVVVVDHLEHVEDDRGFVQECHRVLKPAGRLVVLVPHGRRSLMLRPLRRLLGQSDARLGHVRTGYSESQLFDVLKDGFDVQEVRSYGRFFAEAANLLAQALSARALGAAPGAPVRAAAPGPAQRRRLRTIWAVFGPLAAVGANVDLLLGWTRGHRLLVRAKRRLWIPRKTPVLRDGRSIAEAALGARIGTASVLAEVKETPPKAQSRR